MRITIEEDFVFTKEMFEGSVFTIGSSAYEIAEKLRSFGMMGLKADHYGRTVTDLMTLTGDGSGHCYTGEARANWCFDEDGTMKATIEYTTVE